MIWINGTFGVGKTTAAETLTRDLAPAAFYDPEVVGRLAFELASEPAPDFQDMLLWRRLVADAADALCEHEKAPLIAPMTLVRAAYRKEIFDGLAAKGFRVKHFLLHASRERLAERIWADEIFPEDPAASERVRRFRLARIDEYFAALPQLRREAELIDTDELDAEETAKRLCASAAPFARRP